MATALTALHARSTPSSKRILVYTYLRSVKKLLNSYEGFRGFQYAYRSMTFGKSTTQTRRPPGNVLWSRPSLMCRREYFDWVGLGDKSLGLWQVALEPEASEFGDFFQGAGLFE